MTWDPSSRLLTIEEAARSVNRPASTIRRWMSEGRLKPKASMGPRRPLILESELLECDAKAASRGRRPSPLNERIEHPRKSANSPGE